MFAINFYQNDGVLPEEALEDGAEASNSTKPATVDELSMPEEEAHARVFSLVKIAAAESTSEQTAKDQTELMATFMVDFFECAFTSL